MPVKSTAESTPAKKKKEVQKCHIHDEDAASFNVDLIRKEVCVKKPLLLHSDGKYYCLFHLPTIDKDIVGFEKIFNARLNAVRRKIGRIEKLPKEEQEKARKKVSYNFTRVFFPSDVFLSEDFHADVIFNGATFARSVGFDMGSFYYDANFVNATFMGDTQFVLTSFHKTASFDSVTFFSAVNFNSAVFYRSARFSSSSFSSTTSFRHTIFASGSDFDKVKFLNTSEILFHETRFCDKVNFDYSIFATNVTFAGFGEEIVFYEKKDLVEKLKKWGRKLHLIDYKIPEQTGQGAALSLQYARLENAEKVLFNRVRLSPPWFVNVDSRKMTFTDITWDLDYTINKSTETGSPKKRRISKPSSLLEIAYRQLAVNAEENNRYEEASKFRYMSMEVKRLRYARKSRFWTLTWWYWFSSGYGESAARALVVLLGLLVLFAALYVSPLSKFNYQKKPEESVEERWDLHDKITCASSSSSLRSLNVCEAISHSLYMTALQRPEPPPFDFLTKVFVLFQTILGPLQAALLALAIRRKFMR